MAAIACAQLAAWQAQPQTRALSISVNVSARQFHQPDFVERVELILAETGADPSLLTLEITEDALREVARIAASVNESVENIGARRLQTVMEKLLEAVSFEAEDRSGESVTIDEAYVSERLAGLAKDTDLSKYIL